MDEPADPRDIALAPAESNRERHRGLPWTRALATAALLVVIAAVYARVYAFDFIDYDDNIYVTENPRVLGGLTWENVKWALTTRSMPYWHPLTWLSHMLDVELWGLNPGPPHLVNAALHMANALVVLLILHGMTGRFWLSLITASLFSLHPLRVESVAWVSERKDVLSALFYFLTIGAYVAWARCPTRARYLWLHIAFILALMSKPMAVTLPCVLLLLDYWPLQRLRVGRRDPDMPTEPLARLLMEKLALFTLAVGVGIMAIGDQADAGALKSTESFAVTSRVANAMVAYARYIGMMVWPRDLVIFYPHPGTWPLTVTIASGVAIVLATVLAFRFARQLPFVVVGWLWFLGTLAPVIGLIQVGRQSLADRFTYIPSVGFTVAVVWGLAAFVDRAAAARAVARVAAVAMIATFALLTARQLSFWEGGTLGVFQHALDVREANPEAHHAIGYALLQRGESDAALTHLVRARELDRRSAAVHYLIGEILRGKGQLHDAVASYSTAVELKPDSRRIWLELGITQTMAGDTAAGRSFARATQLGLDPTQIKQRLAELSDAPTSQPSTKSVDGRDAQPVR